MEQVPSHESRLQKFKTRSFEACALGVAALPLAAVAGFNSTEIDTTIEIGGTRTVSVSPTMDGRLTVDSGVLGRVSVDRDSLLGGNVQVGGVPFTSRADAINSGKESDVISSAVNSAYLLNNESLRFAVENIQHDLLIDFTQKTLTYEAVALLALMIGRRKGIKARTVAATLIGANLALLPLSDSPRVMTDEPHTTYTSSFIGDIRIYDRVLSDVLHKILPATEAMRARQVEDNKEFIDTVSTQLPVIAAEITASLDDEDDLILVTSDTHTSSTMLDINNSLADLLQPAVRLDAGDITNYDFTIESFAAKELKPDVVALGNHDNGIIKKALTQEGAITSDTPELVEIPLGGGAPPLRILTVNDPRRTAPGATGVNERKPGIIESTREQLLSIASREDVDIVLVHEPSDLEFLVDNDAPFTLGISGHTHKNSISQTENGATWLQAGTTGGIAPRSIQSFLTPLATPSKEATISYIARNRETGEMRAIYTVTVMPDTQLSLTATPIEKAPTANYIVEIEQKSNIAPKTTIKNKRKVD